MTQKQQNNTAADNSGTNSLRQSQSKSIEEEKNTQTGSLNGTASQIQQNTQPKVPAQMAKVQQ